VADQAQPGAVLLAANRNLRTAAVLGLIVCGMGGLAYASVPLYELFCQVTGFGGTTRIATAPAETILDREVTVRLDSTVSPALPWHFVPTKRSHQIRVGETNLITYQARNDGDELIVGTASFNVTPDKAGQYFNKIDCFCFTEQVLAPGQSVEMPVSFFIDPAIAEDENLDDVNTITLSYTFFRADDQSAAGGSK
jgi:cytochrome c oxidase assembly protein subunit 11